MLHRFNLVLSNNTLSYIFVLGMALNASSYDEKIDKNNK